MYPTRAKDGEYALVEVKLHTDGVKRGPIASVEVAASR